MKEPAPGEREVVQHSALHGQHSRERRAARARAVPLCHDVAQAVPDERHREHMESRDDHLAGLAMLRGASILQDLDDHAIVGDMERAGLRALPSNDAEFVGCVAVVHWSSEARCDLAPQEGREHLAASDHRSQTVCVRAVPCHGLPDPRQQPGRPRDHLGPLGVKPRDELRGRKAAVEQRLSIQADTADDALGHVPVTGIIRARKRQARPPVPGPNPQIAQRSYLKRAREPLLAPRAADRERHAGGAAGRVGEQRGDVHPSSHDVFQWRFLKITPAREGDAGQVRQGPDVARREAMAVEERPVMRNVLVGMIDEAAQVRLLEGHDVVPTCVPVTLHGPRDSRKVRDADHRTAC